MGIFKNIWNSIFGKSQKQEEFEKGGSIGEVPTLKVVHRGKNSSEAIHKLDAEYVCHITKETSTVTFVRSISQNLQPKNKIVTNKIGGYAFGDTKPDKSKSCHGQEVNSWCQPNLAPSNTGVCAFPVSYDPIIPANLAPSNTGVCAFPVSYDPIIPEIKTKITLTNWNKKVLVNSLPLNKQQEVIQYLLKYGSIDKITCAEKFGLKRLDNLICELRKEGMNIKNETIELHNKLGKKNKVNNYRLVSSDATN
jgi:hypothetical protein